MLSECPMDRVRRHRCLVVMVPIVARGGLGHSPTSRHHCFNVTATLDTFTPVLLSAVLKLPHLAAPWFSRGIVNCFSSLTLIIFDCGSLVRATRKKHSPSGSDGAVFGWGRCDKRIRSALSRLLTRGRFSSVRHDDGARFSNIYDKWAVLSHAFSS